MSKSFQNAQELLTYLTNNPSNKNQILANIPDDLKKITKDFKQNFVSKNIEKLIKTLLTNGHVSKWLIIAPNIQKNIKK